MGWPPVTPEGLPTDPDVRQLPYGVPVQAALRFLFSGVAFVNIFNGKLAFSRTRDAGLSFLLGTEQLGRLATAGGVPFRLSARDSPSGGPAPDADLPCLLSYARNPKGDTLFEHLEFALRHEGIDLAALAAILNPVEPARIAEWITSRPNGKFLLSFMIGT